jgi:hypothetical protein
VFLPLHIYIFAGSGIAAVATNTSRVADNRIVVVLHIINYYCCSTFTAVSAGVVDADDDSVVG